MTHKSDPSVGKLRLQTTKEESKGSFTPRKPEHQFKEGRVKLSVWITEGTGKRKNTTTFRYKFTRSYHTGGAWKNISTFEAKDFNDIQELMTTLGNLIQGDAVVVEDTNDVGS